MPRPTRLLADVDAVVEHRHLPLGALGAVESVADLGGVAALGRLRREQLILQPRDLGRRAVLLALQPLLEVVLLPAQRRDLDLDLLPASCSSRRAAWTSARASPCRRSKGRCVSRRATACRRAAATSAPSWRPGRSRRAACGGAVPSRLAVGQARRASRAMAMRLLRRAGGGACGAARPGTAPRDRHRRRRLSGRGHHRRRRRSAADSVEEDRPPPRHPRAARAAPAAPTPRRTR